MSGKIQGMGTAEQVLTGGADAVLERRQSEEHAEQLLVQGGLMALNMFFPNAGTAASIVLGNAS